jgi:hypothetical protein
MLEVILWVGLAFLVESILTVLWFCPLGRFVDWRLKDE